MTLSSSSGSLANTENTSQKSPWEDDFPEGEVVDYNSPEELVSLIQIFRKLSLHMLAEIEKIPQQLKIELIELAILTCEKFLYRKLDNSEELALLISSALQHHITLKSLSPIKIFLHPEDYKKLTDWLTKQEIPLIKQAEFLPDISCKKSGYKMETPSGILRQEIGEELEHLLSVLTA